MKPLPATFFRETAKSEQVTFAAHVMLIIALTCAFLYYGKAVLVPVSLALLLTFLLTPGVKMLQKRGVPKTIAIVLVVMIVFATLTGVGFLVSRQVSALTFELPKYETNLREKVKSLKSFSGSGSMFGSAGDMLDRLGSELDANDGTVAANPVREIAVADGNTGLLSTYRQVLTPVLKPVVEAVLVLIFCIFFLFQRQDLRDRLIRLAGRGDVLRSTVAMDDAASKLSRLFLMQAMLNGGFGLFVGVALWLMGVPAAALWGLFAGLMRFIPYVGAIIAAIFPALLAAAVSPDWTLPLMVVALFLVSEPVIGHVVEPLLFGHTAGLSPVAVITAAAFWTALWGPVGLLLATPLTICLAVLGRHVEGLAFLDVLFGAKPALTPPESFYQRLLTRDRHDALALAEGSVAATGMNSFISEVAVPSLLIAENDRVQKRLSSDDQLALAAEFSAVVEDVFVADADVEGTREDDMVLLVPAPGTLNFAATIALSASLSAAGISHRMLDEIAGSPLAQTSFDAARARLVVLTYLIDPQTERLDFMRRRLKGKFAGLPMIAAGWFASADDSQGGRAHAGVRDLIAARIDDAIAAGTGPSQAGPPAERAVV